MLCLVECSLGARYLQETQSSVSASVSGTGGTTGTIQMSYSSEDGSFTRTIPVASGPATLQFSTDNGGTLSVATPAGPPQVLTSILTNGGVGAGVLPQVNIPPVTIPNIPNTQIPAVPVTGLTTVPFTLPPLDIDPNDPDFAKKIRERIQVLFDQLRASGANFQTLQTGTGPQAAATAPTPVANFAQQNNGIVASGVAAGDNTSILKTGPNSFYAQSSSSGPNAKSALSLSTTTTG